MGAGQSRRQKGPHTASCLPVLTLFAGYFSFICIINGNCSVSPSQPIDNHHLVCTTDKPIREGQNGASDCSVCAELRLHPSKHPRLYTGSIVMPSIQLLHPSKSHQSHRTPAFRPCEGRTALWSVNQVQSAALLAQKLLPAIELPWHDRRRSCVHMQ